MLNMTWWNCRLAPPAAGASRYPVTLAFDETIRSLLEDRNSDIVGLCEVDDTDIEHIEQLLQRPALSHFKVISLYKKGRSIDDLCLIYNTTRLAPRGTPQYANARDTTYDTWLKAGVFICLEMQGLGPVFIGLSHWQSRNTLPEGSPSRFKLGVALNATVTKIRRDNPGAPIILCGDYNDEPFDPSVVHGLGATRDATLLKTRKNALFNPFWPLMGSPSCSELPPGTFLTSGKGVSSLLMFDHMMLCSAALRCWKVAAKSVLNGIPAKEWKKISDHYPISLTLESATP